MMAAVTTFLKSFIFVYIMENLVTILLFFILRWERGQLEERAHTSLLVRYGGEERSAASCTPAHVPRVSFAGRAEECVELRTPGLVRVWNQVHGTVLLARLYLINMRHAAWAARNVERSSCTHRFASVVTRRAKPLHSSDQCRCHGDDLLSRLLPEPKK